MNKLALSPLLLGVLSVPALAAEAIETTEQQVVTVTGYSQNQSQAPASISVITKEDLQGKAFRNLTDALQSLPGVSVEGGPGRKGGNAAVSIRGMDSRYTLILVNGKAQGSRQAYYNGLGQGAEFGWLPPLSAIERIEVVRGPMSSRYGSDALGGVINIITRKGAEAWSGSLAMDTILQGRDSGDSRQVRYDLRGAVAKNLQMAIYGNGYLRDSDRRNNGHRDYSQASTTAELDWQVDQSQQLGLTLGTAAQHHENDSTKTNSNSGDLNQRRQHYALDHQIQWLEGVHTDSYFQSERMKNRTQNAEYRRLNFNTQTEFAMDEGVLVVGADWRRQQTKNPARAKNKATLTRDDMAVFAEYEWFVNDEFSLTGGGRFVHDENYGSEFTPRLYGVYTLTDDWTLKAGISKGYRTPDLKQGDSDWVEGGGGRRIDGADVGNSDLKPEHSVSYELAALWQGDNGLEASATLYHTDFKDRISKPIICGADTPTVYDCSYQGVNYQRVYRYENVDEATISGAELTFGYRGERLDAEVNATYTKSEQQSGSNKGKALNGRSSPSIQYQSRLATDRRTDTVEQG